jgi:tetratricopeptide (TPR) repeat protein
LFGAIVVSALIAWFILWAFYGFRYAARPQGLALNPTLPQYIDQLAAYSPLDARIATGMAHLHLLPEGYIYGLAATKIIAENSPGYFFGHAYQRGHLLYFPAAFVIKSTLPFLILVALAVAAIFTRRLRRWRKLLFLTVPVAIFMAMVLPSDMNIGHRHILPIYPFLMVLVGGAAAAWIQGIGTKRRNALNPAWLSVVVALLVWQAVTSLRAYPVYMAYSNEAWGGPSKTHLYFSDANVDWAQQLKAVKLYLDGRGITTNCWFAFFAQGAVDLKDYGIQCHALPTQETLYWLGRLNVVPTEIDGPVLISDGNLASLELGSGKLNPYQDFRARRPVATIQQGVYVYDGHFAVPLAAALVHAQRAEALVKGTKLKGEDPELDAAAAAPDHLDKALAEASEAIRLAPDNAAVQTAMGDVLAAQGHPAEAHAHYAEALRLAQTVEPEFQFALVPELKKKLAGQ